MAKKFKLSTSPASPSHHGCPWWSEELATVNLVQNKQSWVLGSVPLLFVILVLGSVPLLKNHAEFWILGLRVPTPLFTKNLESMRGCRWVPTQVLRSRWQGESMAIQRGNPQSHRNLEKFRNADVTSWGTAVGGRPRVLRPHSSEGWAELAELQPTD